MESYEKLESKGYNSAIIEKLYRISDVLEFISRNSFLKKRLAFTGGTALNFIIFPEIMRLSVDLDFDFRVIDSETDWEKTRDSIDFHIKALLRNLEYDDDNIKIDPKFPLTRFIVKYDLRASFNIEIGYMNRYSLFSSDEVRKFVHPKTGKVSKLRLPKKEEIFAGKCAALISRRFPRDLFDTAIIAKQEFNRKLMRKALLLKNMMNPKYNFTTLNFPSHLRAIRADDNLKIVLGNIVSKSNFLNHKEIVVEFLNQLQTEFTDDEKKCFSLFLSKHEFNTDLLGNQELFHQRITDHPSILRSLQKMKAEE